MRAGGPRTSITLCSLFQIGDSSTFEPQASGHGILAPCIVYRVSGTLFLFLAWQAMIQVSIMSVLATHAAAFILSIDASSNNFLAGWAGTGTFDQRSSNRRVLSAHHLHGKIETTSGYYFLYAGRTETEC
jgi:hypothetical protein